MDNNDVLDELNADLVPEADDTFTPEGYTAPDYDETEPLEGDTHEGVSE